MNAAYCNFLFFLSFIISTMLSGGHIIILVLVFSDFLDVFIATAFVNGFNFQILLSEKFCFYYPEVIYICFSTYCCCFLLSFIILKLFYQYF